MDKVMGEREGSGRERRGFWEREGREGGTGVFCTTHAYMISEYDTATRQDTQILYPIPIQLIWYRETDCVVWFVGGL